MICCIMLISLPENLIEYKDCLTLVYHYLFIIYIKFNVIKYIKFVKYGQIQKEKNCDVCDVDGLERCESISAPPLHDLLISPQIKTVSCDTYTK